VNNRKVGRKKSNKEGKKRHGWKNNCYQKKREAARHQGEKCNQKGSAPGLKRKPGKGRESKSNSKKKKNKGENKFKQNAETVWEGAPKNGVSQGGNQGQVTVRTGLKQGSIAP